MRAKLAFLCVGVLLAFSVLAASVVAAAAEDTQTVRGDFEATIRQGPNAGLSLAGRLTIEVGPSGDLVGLLSERGGSKVEVTGKLTDGSIHLTLHLGDGISIFGVGSLPDGLQKGVTIEGVALGPEPGDKGDWEYEIPISYQPPAVTRSNSTNEVIER